MLGPCVSAGGADRYQLKQAGLAAERWRTESARRWSRRNTAEGWLAAVYPVTHAIDRRKFLQAD